jgi:hypothetical protein
VYPPEAKSPDRFLYRGFPRNIVRETVEGFYGVKFDLDEPARRFLQGYLGKFVAQFPEAIII